MSVASRGDSVWGVEKVEKTERVVAPAVSWHRCLTYTLGKKWAIGHSKPMLMACTEICLSPGSSDQLQR